MVIPADDDKSEVEALPRQTLGSIVQRSGHVWREVAGIEDGGASLERG